MASHKELQSLKEEERVLMKIASKLSDQLNRLKVEELALLSQIRSSEQQSLTSDIEPKKEMELQGPEAVEQLFQKADVRLLSTQPSLDLGVGSLELGTRDVEQESEEEEDTEHDQLTVFIQQLEQKSGQSQNG